MTGWNVFRITGDCLHMLSKCILIFAIHRNRSAEGVSLITQVLYAVVFLSRYTDVFSEPHLWNLAFKIIYIISSLYIIGIMRWLYPRSRERELAWRMAAVIVAGSLILSPFGMLMYDSHHPTFKLCLRAFSDVLESFAVLPQLLLLRQTTVPTVIDSFYLVTLGSYKAFYLLNWIERATDSTDQHPNAYPVICGVIQVLFYLDFAWVYYSRQRVKLRHGGIVDSDDIRHGWLLSRIFGKHFDRHSGDEESAPALGGDDESSSFGGGPRGGNASSNRPGNKWGARGISVSADDTTVEQERLFEAERSDGHHNLDASVDPDAKMRDPDELARALDEEEDEDGAPPPAGQAGSSASGVRNDEWND